MVFGLSLGLLVTGGITHTRAITCQPVDKHPLGEIILSRFDRVPSPGLSIEKRHAM